VRVRDRIALLVGVPVAGAPKPRPTVHNGTEITSDPAMAERPPHRRTVDMSAWLHIDVPLSDPHRLCDTVRFKAI
jgi:hypothetical protein